MPKKRDSLKRDSVPEGFTLSMTIVDALPVLLFGGSVLAAAAKLKSLLFCIGGILCILAGLGKVMWKLLVVLMKQNIWFLNRQMRVLMPVGFFFVFCSFIIEYKRIDLLAIWHAITSLPSVLFFVVSIMGMVAMGCCAGILDGSDVRSNWIEQVINTITQACLLMGIMFI